MHLCIHSFISFICSFIRPLIFLYHLSSYHHFIISSFIQSSTVISSPPTTSNPSHSKIPSPMRSFQKYLKKTFRFARQDCLNPNTVEKSQDFKPSKIRCSAPNKVHQLCSSSNPYMNLNPSLSFPFPPLII